MADIFFRRVGKIKINSKAFLQEFLYESEKQAELVKLEYKTTVSTWRRKPIFYKRVLIKDAGISIQVFTDDRIYHFLEGGTNVRWAVMKQGFVSKTAPGRIQSISGAGGVFVRGRRRVAAWEVRTGLIDDVSEAYPMPGIDARQFSKMIRTKLNKGFRSSMKNAAARGTRRMLSSG